MRRALAWLAVAAVAMPVQPARAGSASSAAAYPKGAATRSAAATPQATAPTPPASSAAPGASLPAPSDGTLRLALLDAVRLSIVNNLDIELERFDPLVAEQNLKAAWGNYDPRAFADGGHFDTQTPTASTIVGSILLHDKIDRAEGGVRGLIPVIGGSYSASYSGSSEETDSRIQVLSPQFTTAFLATLQVPLLRGLLWGDAWTQVRVSQIGLDATRDTFAAKLMDQVALTQNAYWALVAAQANTRVAQKSLDTAKALLEQTKAQFDVGVVSKVEVVQAEAGVADRDFKLITADAVERNTQDALIDNVLGPYLGPNTRLDVDPSDSPEEMPVHEVDPESATTHALSTRPEVAAAKRDIDRRTVELRYASNQRLPQLDVLANYSNNGLAGRANPDCLNFGGPPGSPCPVPPVIGRHWTDANDDFFTPRAPRSFAVQGVFSIPLGNVTPRADYQKARLELRRSETALRRLEQSIISDIRRAARNLLAAIEGIDAAERAVVAATEQLRAERVRLEYGESTPFDVLLKEQDLVQAEQQKIAAQQVYHNSITELDRAEGTILTRDHIVVEEAAPLR
jgi:outer membrane protein TolC